MVAADLWDAYALLIAHTVLLGTVLLAIAAILRLIAWWF